MQRMKRWKIPFWDCEKHINGKSIYAFIPLLLSRIILVDTWIDWNWGPLSRWKSIIAGARYKKTNKTSLVWFSFGQRDVANNKAKSNESYYNNNNNTFGLLSFEQMKRMLEKEKYII